MSKTSSKKRSKKWDSFVVPAEMKSFTVSDSDKESMLLPAGYSLRFFPHNMKTMFCAPSHLVTCTRGVLEYIAEYNQLGPNKTKTKLFLCTMKNRDGTCANGYHCREVHCVVHVDPVPTEQTFADLESAVAASKEGTSPTPEHITCNTVHTRVNNPEAYERLPAGVEFRLALPNMQCPVDVVSSEDIFVTKGARDFYEHMLREGTPSMNMQHCAHFSKNGMCCFGPDCQFVHVARAAERDQERESDSDSSSRRHRTSSVSSTGSSQSARSALSAGSQRRPLPRETPLSGDASVETVPPAHSAPPMFVVPNSGAVPQHNVMPVIYPQSVQQPHIVVFPQHQQGMFVPFHGLHQNPPGVVGPTNGQMQMPWLVHQVPQQPQQQFFVSPYPPQ